MSFRLASALELKRLGLRFIGGAFKEPDAIECVRTKVSFETTSQKKLVLDITSCVYPVFYFVLFYDFRE